MRLAIPTNDDKTIFKHFGRCAAFLVLEIENGQIKSRERRTNTARHGHGAGMGAHRHEDDGSQSHAGILRTLAGCETVICSGMGHGAAEALRSAGVTTVVAGGLSTIEDAVAAYLKGELANGPAEYCRCGH